MNTFDDAWFSQLIGRSNDKSNQDNEQIEVLRSVMQQQYLTDIDGLKGAGNTQLKKLLQRCKNEGLLAEKRRWWGSVHWMPQFAGVAVVCLLLIAGVNIVEYQQTPKQEVDYRGGGGQQLKFVRQVNSPMEAALKLKNDFEMAGASVLIYQVNDDWYVQIDVETPHSDPVSQLLNQYQIPSMNDAQLRIMFKRIQSHSKVLNIK